MSQINFDTLAARRPDLDQAWKNLRRWFGQHPRIKFVDVPRLARELPVVPDRDLALALTTMAELGFLRLVYRVVTPTGELLDNDFSSPENVPDQMPDRFHTHFFETAEGDIVPGYLVEPSGAPR